MSNETTIEMLLNTGVLHNTYFLRSPIVYFSWSIITMMSCILYVFVIYKLVRNRHKEPFNSSFFKLWINLGIIDCIYMLYLYVTYKCLFNSYVPTRYHLQFEREHPLAAMYLTHLALNCLGLAQMTGLLMLAINRMSAMFRPLGYSVVSWNHIDNWGGLRGIKTELMKYVFDEYFKRAKLLYILDYSVLLYIV